MHFETMNEPRWQEEEEAAAKNNELMYLPESHWSPRYDGTFYTIKCSGFTLVTNNRPSIPREIQGKTSLPAYYYSIAVYREHEKRIVLRRYSHFRWLYQQILSRPPAIQSHHSTLKKPIQLPFGTCPLFQWQDDNFAATRQELLSQFMEDILGRPGYANHAAVKTFLEL